MYCASLMGSSLPWWDVRIRRRDVAGGVGLRDQVLGLRRTRSNRARRDCLTPNPNTPVTWKKPRPSDLLGIALQEEIDLVVVAEEKQKAGGLSLSVIVSLVLHSAFILWFLQAHRAAPAAAKNVPIARYVELIQQNPRQFTEAPGPAVDKTPLNAPHSDANRKASMPEPSGLTPTKRPGDDSGLFTPPTPRAAPRQQQQPQMAQQAQPQSIGQQATASTPSPAQQRAITNDTFVYREPTETSKASAAASAQIDWRNAIREVKGPIGGSEGLDFGSSGSGGERGLAEQGPLSFETAWYDWGPYAQSMVSKHPRELVRQHAPAHPHRHRRRGHHPLHHPARRPHHRRHPAQMLRPSRRTTSPPAKRSSSPPRSNPSRPTSRTATSE